MEIGKQFQRRLPKKPEKQNRSTRYYKAEKFSLVFSSKLRLKIFNIFRRADKKIIKRRRRKIINIKII